MNTAQTITALAEWPLIYSHLLLVPLLVFAFRRWIVLLAAHTVITLLASTMYHTCRAFSTCALNLSVSHFSNFDFIGALGMIPVVSLLAVTNFTSLEYLALGHHQREYKGVPMWYYYRELFYTITVYQLQQFLVVYVVFTFDVKHSIYPTILIIGVAALGMLVKLMIVDTGRHMVITKYKVGWLAFGLVWICASVIFFPFDDGNYWWAHLLWHVLSFPGIFAISVGMSTGPHKPVNG